eukprot:TRINITY_DN9171_c0_g1_i2.p1 TRINITY_DN9171_c0_g1~~TRINITY_DN9171_c0_g1_i2.p1  ORF type:complete len:393 (-),score=65.78 TRINITY_DN9171_c0_g1_i2:92-1270(-)
MAMAIVLDSGDEDDLEVSVVGEVLAGSALKMTRKALRKSSKKKQSRHCRRLKEKAERHIRGRRAHDESKNEAAEPPLPSASQPKRKAVVASAPAWLSLNSRPPSACEQAAGSCSVLTVSESPSPAILDSSHCRVRAAADVPPAFCTECRRPLDAAGAAAAIVEFRRPWIAGLSRVHAQHRCLQSAGLLSFLGPAPQRLSRTLPETHGVLRSLRSPVAGQLREKVAGARRIGSVVGSQQRRGHLAAARQLAAAAAMRAVRRAASDAAGDTTSEPRARRRHRQRSADQQDDLAQRVVSRPSKSDVIFEALLSALPPSQRAKRDDVPKGERCAVCHGKLLRKGRRVRRLPCGHMIAKTLPSSWASELRRDRRGLERSGWRRWCRSHLRDASTRDL